MNQQEIDDYFVRQTLGARAMIPSWDREVIQQGGSNPAPCPTRREHLWWAKSYISLAIRHLRQAAKFHESP